jgi:predicted hydrolase (HD superfamily)
MKINKFKQLAQDTLDQNIFYHSLALAQCMVGLYDYFSKNNLIPDQQKLSRDDWYLAGLIHDIDYLNPYKEDHPNHTREVLQKHNLDVDDEIIQIVKAHAPKISGVNPQSLAQWSIFCADSLTGLIVAVALVYPSRKLADVKLKSIVKRFLKEPRFAAGTRREEVKMCEKSDGLNLPLEKFIEICFESMKSISSEIGL